MCCARIRYGEASHQLSATVLLIPLGLFSLPRTWRSAAAASPSPIQPHLIFQPLAMTRTGIALGPDRERPGQKRALNGCEPFQRIGGDRPSGSAPRNLSGVFIPAGGFASSANRPRRFVGDAAPGARLGGQRCSRRQAVKDLF